jgi:hypothetical protein
MANPTTNFGWQMPTATDLVTDLPADFEVFGQAVDTDFVGLKGGTTGQVLAKASGTDLDFVWSADAAGMTNPMTTTADIIYSSSGSTPARLGIGSTDDVLTVAGGVPTWAAPAGGGKVLQVVSFVTGTTDTSTSRTFADSSLTLNITPTSATSKVLVMVCQNGVSKSNTATDNDVKLRLMRGATSLAIFADGALYTNSALALVGMSQSFSYLDSPATTSATTYKTQFALGNGNTGPIYCQQSNENSSIVLMEIGA